MFPLAIELEGQETEKADTKSFQPVELQLQEIIYHAHAEKMSSAFLTSDTVSLINMSAPQSVCSVPSKGSQ